MINEPLSDVEITGLIQCSVSDNPIKSITYVNKLLSKRTLGDDHCARPLSFRNKDDVKEPCFALGYITKIEEFINETKKHSSDKLIIKDVLNYIYELKKEINTFFGKHNKKM